MTDPSRADARSWGIALGVLHEYAERGLLVQLAATRERMVAATNLPPESFTFVLPDEPPALRGRPSLVLGSKTVYAAVEWPLVAVSPWPV